MMMVYVMGPCDEEKDMTLRKTSAWMKGDTDEGQTKLGHVA